jgi:tetratricopeptide (TPR) repeat protein
LAEPTDAQGYANPPTTAAPEVAEATDPAADGLADSFPTPYIIDFGLARVEGTSGHTASSAIIGTPAYMAPEQAAGRNQEVTAAADIYGLGTILYQLLTRQLPFQGHSDLETLQAVQFAEPTAPRRIRGEIPRDLEAICLRCLEKSPSHRYASAASLYADLGRFLAGAPVEARSIGRVERLRRWARRNPALAAVSAVAGVLFFVGAASVTWQWWRAERSLAELREQQDRATRYLHSAQEAVDELLTDLAAELGDLPQTEMIRGRLLRRAAVINQRFLNDETLDPAAAGLVSIQAWYRAANIARQLGDLDGMQAALERMIALCGAQPASGRDPDILAKQISAQAMLSSAAVARNDWTESQRHLQDGLELLDRSREQPTAYRNLLRAELLRNLGMDAERQGQLDEAKVHYGRAMELVTQTPTLYDDDSQLTLIRVKAHNSFAIHCKQLGKFPEASQHFQATQELLATLRKRAPDSAELQAMMAQNQYNLANLDLAAQRHGPARARYLNAKNDFKQLAARFPGIVKYRDLWCYSLQGAALASPEPEQFKNRVLMLKKAAFLREEIARDYPDLVDNAVQLAKAYRNLGRDYFGARQYTEARHCLRRAVECGPGANASAAVQGYDRENDTAACSLLGRLEMKCQNWGQAVVWFGQAISLRDAGGSRFQDTDDYVRDQAAYGKALVRADRRDEGIRHLRALPASTPDRPTRDLIVARALLDVAELVADATAERVADKSLARELRTDAIARLHSAWQHGDDHVQDFALSPEAEVLGAIPQFQELLAEMRSSSTRPNP